MDHKLCGGPEIGMGGMGVPTDRAFIVSVEDLRIAKSSVDHWKLPTAFPTVSDQFVLLRYFITAVN